MTRVSQTLAWFGLIIVASLVLYHISDRANVLEQQLHSLNADIESEQKAMHVLRAEWVYLANPQRLETSAHKFLALRPTAPRQIVKLDDLGEALAHRDAVASNVSVTSTPIASLHTTLRTTLAALSPREAPPAKNPRNKLGIMAVASVDTSHINDRMMIERASGAALVNEPSDLESDPSSDPIGNLITNSGHSQ